MIRAFLGGFKWTRRGERNFQQMGDPRLWLLESCKNKWGQNQHAVSKTHNNRYYYVILNIMRIGFQGPGFLPVTAFWRGQSRISRLKLLCTGQAFPNCLITGVRIVETAKTTLPSTALTGYDPIITFMSIRHHSFGLSPWSGRYYLVSLDGQRAR
jgi:hypothetical protein